MQLGRENEIIRTRVYQKRARKVLSRSLEHLSRAFVVSADIESLKSRCKVLRCAASSEGVVDVLEVKGTLTVTEGGKSAVRGDVKREAVALNAVELF